MTKQRVDVVPTTSLGKWSVALIVTMPLLFFIGTSLASSLYRDIAAGGTILRDIAMRPALALTMLTGIGCGLASFLTGLVAIARERERALMVYISTAFGGLVLLFLAGEALSTG
jgi:hypothetical protein